MQLVESCLHNLSEQPITIRLSGWVENNDRLALREIAKQLTLQTGTTYNAGDDDPEPEEEPNPFLDVSQDSEPAAFAIPPSSHLHSLVALLPTLNRPVVVILDAFDLFAMHARQSLLYCLFDTVQSCRSGSTGKGLAVIGVTSRIDTINLLEKRVKSRFSGRMLRVAAPRVLNGWIDVAREVLSKPAGCAGSISDAAQQEWNDVWNSALVDFFGQKGTTQVFNETFSVTRDVRVLLRILVRALSTLCHPQF